MNEDFIQGSYYQNNFTKEQNQLFQVQFEEITLKMVAALEAGESYYSENMQSAVAEFYQFTCQFWTPNREAWKSLAMNYVLPTGYRDTFEGYKSGLAKFVYDAVCHFADENLS